MRVPFIMFCIMLLGFAIGFGWIGQDYYGKISCDQIEILISLETEYDDGCLIKFNGVWVELDSYIEYLEGDK